MSGIQFTHWYSPLFTLRWRLALVFSALLVIFVSVLSLFLYDVTSDQLLSNTMTISRQHAFAMRSQWYTDACARSPQQTPQDFIQEHLDNDTTALYFLDKSGLVVASNQTNLINHLFPYASQPLLANAAHNTQVAQTFATDSTHQGLLLSLDLPASCLTQAHAPVYLAVLTSYANEQSTMNTLLLLLGLASTLVIIAGVLIISFVTAVMLRPLHEVTRATRALAQGDLHQRVPVSGSADEIGELGESFNTMARRIEQMFAAQQASEQRARRFVSDASHELRTPITSLRGFTEILLRGAKNDPHTTEHVLKLMKNEAERMTKLVNDLLTLARLDEGQFAEPEEIDLIDLAVECLQQTKKQAPSDCKLALEMATHERLKVSVAREPFKNMLLILLDNAVKYGCTSEEKKLMLLLDKKGQSALIQVIDNGPGIPPEDLPHIFDRFYRGRNAHESGSSPIPGTGLGLAVASAIAQAYQGQITVCSEPHGETVFTVSLPCND